MKKIPYWFKQLFLVILTFALILGTALPVVQKYFNSPPVTYSNTSIFRDFKSDSGYSGDKPKSIRRFKTESKGVETLSESPKYKVFKEICGVGSNIISMLFPCATAIYSCVLWLRHRKEKKNVGTNSRNV